SPPASTGAGSLAGTWLTGKASIDRSAKVSQRCIGADSREGTRRQSSSSLLVIKILLSKPAGESASLRGKSTPQARRLACGLEIEDHLALLSRFNTTSPSGGTVQRSGVCSASP